MVLSKRHAVGILRNTDNPVTGKKVTFQEISDTLSLGSRQYAQQLYQEYLEDRRRRRRARL